MPTTDNLNRARMIYQNTRQIWFARSVLDAYERLAVITVAANLRHFAFLTYLAPRMRKQTSELLSGLGLHTRTLCARFDLEIKTAEISFATKEAYTAFKLRNERFFGLGIWANSGQDRALGSSNVTHLGSALGYPECCVQMDVKTKLLDHTLFLRALVREVGDDPDQVRWALRRKSPIAKSSEKHLRQWQTRYEETLSRFPFALHAACDACLKSSVSPTAILSARYEELARQVSEELHFLVRWAARIRGGGRNS